MPVQRTDIVNLRSVTVNDTNLNGGEMGTIQIVDNVSANVFPVVSQAQRIAGNSGQWRKLFVKNKESLGSGLFNTFVYIENPTPAEDMVFLAAGTLTDTQGDLSSPRLFGCGWLSASVSGGATSITVLVEDGTVQIFQVGDKIRISDKANVDALTGNEEYRTITSVAWAGDVATIGLDTGLDNSYSSVSQATRVSSLLSLSTLQSSASAPVVTSVGGTYDNTNFPILGDNNGSIRQNVTLTFTSSTAFTILGDTLGSLGSGNISGVNCAPNNPSVGAPYWTINASGFGGTFQAGDTITFSVTPSAKGIWLKRVIPVNTPSMAGNRFVLVVEGESE